jgi:hypothetical protein
VEELRFISLFRCGRNLLVLAFVAGALLAPQATTHFVFGLAEQHVAERLERLWPQMTSPPAAQPDKNRSQREQRQQRGAADTR